MTLENPLSFRIGRRVGVALRLLISLILVGAAVAFADVSAVKDALSGLNPTAFAAASALLIAQSGLQAARWRLVSTTIGIVLPISRAWRLILIGMFFNQVLPSSLGGDALRIWLLRRDHAVPLGSATTTVLLERLVGLCAAFAIVTLGLPALFSWSDSRPVRIAAVVAAGAGLAALFFPFAVRLIARTIRSRNSFISRTIHRVAEDTTSLVRNPGVLLRTTVLSLFIHAAFSTAAWLLLRGLGVHSSWTKVAILVPLVLLVSTVPISIAGWGVREGGMVVALGAIGVDSASAVAFSILFGLSIAAAGIPGMALWLATGRRSLIEADPV